MTLEKIERLDRFCRPSKASCERPRYEVEVRARPGRVCRSGNKFGRFLVSPSILVEYGRRGFSGTAFGCRRHRRRYVRTTCFVLAAIFECVPNKSHAHIRENTDRYCVSRVSLLFVAEDNEDARRNPNDDILPSFVAT